MGYRIDNRPPKPEDHLLKFSVRNGATLRAAFRCKYWDPIPGHDPHYHDYIGWPAPNYPGFACQMRQPRDRFPWFRKPLIRAYQDMDPIHLTEEGYSEASVSFDDQDIIDNIDATAFIDPIDDSIVRITVNTDFPSFKDKPLECRFTVFVKSGTGDSAVKDVVCHGILSVLPGSPYSN